MMHDEGAHRHSRAQTPGGAIAGFIMLLAMAIIFASMGAPGVFVGFAILMAILALVGGLASSASEERKVAEAEQAEADAREQFKEEVARSVKDSLKGTIKIRCRYCGALNGEQDEKCESCGAPL